MAKILIVFATDHGSTKKMAEAIAEGAGSVQGSAVEIKEAAEATQDDLLANGCPCCGVPRSHGERRLASEEIH